MEEVAGRLGAMEGDPRAEAGSCVHVVAGRSLRLGFGWELGKELGWAEALQRKECGVGL